MKTLKKSYPKLLATAVLIGICVLDSNVFAAPDDGSSNDIGLRLAAAVVAAIATAARSCRW
jgi:hypothetical protein